LTHKNSPPILPSIKSNTLSKSNKGNFTSRNIVNREIFGRAIIANLDPLSEAPRGIRFLLGVRNGSSIAALGCNRHLKPEDFGLSQQVPVIKMVLNISLTGSWLITYITFIIVE